VGDIENSSTHREWRHIIRLCYVPAQQGYAEIGGRGIGVYKPWRDSFDNFLRDMGPGSGRRLQRRDRKKGFNKANCYWGMRDV
jgi:hypothetical protein